MRSYGTEQLLSLGRAEGPYFVWDEHLGKGDMPPMDEDRVFCTAFAAVALMDTWAVETPTDKHNRVGMRFIDQTPEKIKKAIKGKMRLMETLRSLSEHKKGRKHPLKT